MSYTKLIAALSSAAILGFGVAAYATDEAAPAEAAAEKVDCSKLEEGSKERTECEAKAAEGAKEGEGHEGH